jgi:ribonucleotide reductase beta subunit family protein with ferritin-like domain
MPEYLSQIETPSDSHVYRYPPAIKTAIEQMDIFWPAEELGLENDELDFRHHLTKGESYAVRYLQSILTKYEVFIGGQDLWGNKIPCLFPRTDIARACSVISMVENHSHAPFYMLADKIMNTASDEFYSAWREDPILAPQIAYVEDLVKTDNPLHVTAALCFMEGVKIFSVLGFFKCFNTKGFNLISHFVSGIDGSAKDENFHSMFSAYLHNQCKYERTELGNHTDEQEKELKQIIGNIAINMDAHEAAIIDHIFDYSDSLPLDQRIRVTTREAVHHFKRDRINVVLSYLNQEPMFNEPKGDISKDFYRNLSTYKYSDFFANTQLQYKRNYSLNKLGFDAGALENV